MQHHPTPPPSAPSTPVVTAAGLHVKTGVKAGLGWSGIFFGGVTYPR